MVFEDNRLVPVLYGEQNAHLHAIERALDVHINSRGNEITITGAPDTSYRARQILDALWSKIQQGDEVDSHTVESALRFMNEGLRRRSTDSNGNGAPHDFLTFTGSVDQIVTRKKKIAARTPLQADYIEAMRKNELTFGIGPAGTGKTYLAVAMAVSMLEAGSVERIILSRPAVEAGERLGFLPGEMKEKMDPYLRPLYDALHDTMAGEKVQKMILSEEIEIAPLAFMRGRTLNNAFIILDEAQNTTRMQMLMFLTRFGERSRMVVTGDPSQTDLPAGTSSGLVDAPDILRGTEGIAFIRFGDKDVVRSKLVSRIIQAYDKRSGK